MDLGKEKKTRFSTYSFFLSVLKVLLSDMKCLPSRTKVRNLSSLLSILQQGNEKRNDCATIDQSDMRGLGTA